MSTKVGAATLGGALALILVWAVKQFVGVDVPGEVKDAIGIVFTIIVTLAAGWFTPELNPTPSMVQAVREGKGAAK